METSDKIGVLYVAGLGRSGSKLLGNVLGQVDGFILVGEISSSWEHGLVGNKICGCGARVADCVLWQSLAAAAFGSMWKVDLRKIIRLPECWARTKHISLILTPLGRRLIEHCLAEYLDAPGRLCCAVLITTGGRVIVDTSESPSYSFALGLASLRRSLHGAPRAKSTCLGLLSNAQETSHRSGKLRVHVPAQPSSEFCTVGGSQPRHRSALAALTEMVPLTMLRGLHGRAPKGHRAVAGAGKGVGAVLRPQVGAR